MVIYFGEPAEILARVEEWMRVCTPAFGVCEEDTVVGLRGGLSFESEMVREETVGNESHPMVVIIYRRCEEWATDGLTPVLPSVVDIMVIIRIAGRYLVVDSGSVVPIYRAGLVFHVGEFINDIGYEWVLGEFTLDAVKAVDPRVVEEKHRMVLVVMLVINTSHPTGRVLPFKAEAPIAEIITFDVSLLADGSI